MRPSVGIYPPYNCHPADNRENKLKNAEELLRTSVWGPSLSAEEMAKALAGTFERSFAPGAFICMKGEPVDYWMGIIDGLGKMASHWTTGKTTSLTGISTGGWFGEGSLLKSETRRYDVMALRETRVAFMSRSTFLWLLDHSIPFNRYMIAQLNERLGQFIGMIENERMLDTDARIARGLAALFNPVLYPGTNRLLQISQEELGYLAGVSRQRANQALKVLEDAGLVRSEYGGINILDLDGLRTFGD
jgi:CRP-like cAMP-binding protein